MRLSHSVKRNLSVVAALAGLGLLSVTARQTSRQPSQPLRRQPATDSDSLAALRDELRAVTRHAPASGGAAHGREADTPSEIPARGWRDIAKRTVSQVAEHRLMTEGAGITFYAILAIFPALAALVSVYGLVADPATVSGQLNALSGIVPGGGMDILGDELTQLVSAGGGKLGLGAIIGILVALWSANGGTKAMFDSLNVVYDEHEKRGYIRRTLVSLAVTLGTLVFVMLVMAAVVALPIALNFVGLGKVYRHHAPRGALAAAAGHRHRVARRHLSLRAKSDRGALALGELGRGVCGDRLGSGLARFLLVRRAFRQLQQDLWLARCCHRLHDVDLDLGDHRAHRRGTERGDGAPDEARHHHRDGEAARRARRQQS